MDHNSINNDDLPHYGTRRCPECGLYLELNWHTPWCPHYNGNDTDDMLNNEGED